MLAFMCSYMLGQSPGGISFESAPFKLPQEYIDLLSPRQRELLRVPDAQIL